MSLCVVQLDAVTRECSTLHQDLANHRQTKQTVDQQWRLERERLESELTCRQNHSAQPLSVWDKVRWNGARISALRPDICDAQRSRHQSAAGLEPCWYTIILICTASQSLQTTEIIRKALQAVSGAEDLKEQLLKIEGEWQNMRDELGKEKEARVEAERQLQEVMQQKDSLQVGL